MASPGSRVSPGSLGSPAKIGTSDMDKSKQRLLETNGWKVSDVREFLELTDQEFGHVEARISHDQRKKRKVPRRTAKYS